MKITEKINAEILRSLRSDRDKGFRLLFDAYYMPLCLYSLQMTDDFDAAEDIVQTLFVDFWEKNLHEAVNGNLRAYMFTAVRNNTLRYVSKHKNLGISFVDDTPGLLEQLLYGEQSEEDMRMCEEQLRQSLLQLSEMESEVLHKIVVDEDSYKSAAADLGISVNTLKTYLRRAMNKLRKCHVSILLFYTLSM